MWDQNEDLYIILIRGWNDPWKTKSGHRYQELSLRIATFLWQTLIIMVFIPNQINMNNRLWCMSGIAYKKTLALPSYRETLKQKPPAVAMLCSTRLAVLCRRSAWHLLAEVFVFFSPTLWHLAVGSRTRWHWAATMQEQEEGCALRTHTINFMHWEKVMGHEVIRGKTKSNLSSHLKQKINYRPLFSGVIIHAGTEI